MKRVLLLIKGLGRGGAEQLLASSAPYWDRRRYEYEIAFLLPWKDAFVSHFERLSIPAHCLNGGRGLGWAKRLRRLVRQGKFDIVHIHSPYPAVIGRTILGSHRGPPRIVYTEHNLWERYHRVTYWGNALTFPRNAHVFAVSDHVKDSIKYPFPLGKRRVPPIETLYHGIDFATMDSWGEADGVREELQVASDAPLVGSISNLKKGKGHEYLLQSALLVRERVPGVRFVLVGTGPLEREIRNMASTMGLDGTVIFTGFRDDATRLAKAFDVFALPSVHEGLSIALIEAMATGRACVCTDVGGIPEVVEDGKHAILVPARDPGRMAEAIVAVLEDGALRERLSTAAVDRAAAFGIERAVRRQEELYKELVR